MKPKHKQNKIASIKYYSMEKVTLMGFCNFCKNNIPLIIAVTIMLFFTYGIRLFWHSIGIDTELFFSSKSDALKWSMAIGRFGYVLLSKLWYIKEFNPFTAFFTAFCLIWFFTISWCYIIAIFSRDTIKNKKLIPFALLFMTAPVWAEQFYFLAQAAENALIISLCPYVIYLLFKGFLDHEKGKIVCAFILLVFMISVYQAIVPMFCCGVFICFVLLQEHSDYKPQVYRGLCLILLITLVGSLMIYFFIERVIIPVVFDIDRSEYLDSMIGWGKQPIKTVIYSVLLFCCTIIGPIPLVQNIVYPFIMHDAQVADAIVKLSRISGNILLLPAVIFFLLKITAIMRRKFPKGKRFLYFLAGIGIPLSIVFLAFIGGNYLSIRVLFVLPLASAFMIFFIIKHSIKKIAVIVACLTLFVAVYQAEITAQLFYSDQMRYNEDVRFAYDLNNLITQIQPADRKLPVAIVGKYQTASRFYTNFLPGDIVGLSVFEIGRATYARTAHGLAFMKSLGINFDMPNEKQLQQAHKEAASIPPYPDPGCVKRMQDYIVVRISETLYEWR